MAREPVLVTAPTLPSVRPVEVRNQLLIHHRQHDNWLRNRIIAGTEEAENFTWSRFVTQTWKQYFDLFSDPMELRYPPLSSVASIQYIDSSGTTQTVASTVYELADDDGVGLVRLKYGQTWPTPRGHDDDVWITFVCGYGTPAEVPQTIKHAIILYTAHQWNNREGETPIPQAFYDLLRNYSYRRPRPVEA